MTGLVDSHCHLGHLDRPVDEVLAQAGGAGVERVVDIGMGLASSGAVAGRAAAFPQVMGSVGIHPNDLTDFEAGRDEAVATLGELASRPGIVAIGETGLDFYRDRWDRRIQMDAFRAQIELAKRCDRTLVIHCRDAHDDVLAVLDGVGAPARVVMHCFSGDASYARECGERGYFCSFAGNLTYKRNDDLRAAARVVPAELLLVETDAPFLAPVPFRGKPNAPALVVHTARVLADVRSTELDALVRLLSANTNRAFVISPHDLH